MYKIVKCYNCKKYAMTAANKRFKCISCSKSFDVEKMKIFFESFSAKEVSLVLRKIKEESFENSYDDFLDAL